MSNKIVELKGSYEKSFERKKQIKNISRVFKDFLQFMQSELSSHTKKSSFFSCMCLKQSRATVNTRFVHAYKNLNDQEKLQYYIDSINYAYEFESSQQQQKDKNEPEQQSQRFNVIKQGFGGQEVTVRLLRYKLEIKDGSTLDLRNYLLRRSSNTKRNSYVLESINKIEPKEFKFRFQNDMDNEKYMPKIQKVIKLAHRSLVIRMAFVSKNQEAKKNEKMIKQLVPKTIEVINQTNKNKNFNQTLQDDPNKAMAAFMSFSKKAQQTKQKQDQYRQQQTGRDKIPVEIETVIKYSHHLSHKQSERNLDSPKNIEKAFSKKQMQKAMKKPAKHINIFQKFYPDRSINEIVSLTGFKEQFSSSRSNFKIFIQNINFSYVKQIPSFKVSMTSNLSTDIIVKSIINFQKYREWHSEVKDATIEMHLEHENSYIIQMVHHSSVINKDALFTFLAHCFYYEGAYYVLQKEVKQEAEFLHHTNQKLGRIYYGLWKVKESKDGKTSIIYETKMKHPGVTNIQNQILILLNYLKGYQNLSEFYNNKRNNSSLLDLLVLKWYYRNNDELSQIQEESIMEKINSGEFGGCQAISDSMSEMKTAKFSNEDQDIILENVQQFETFLNKSKVSIDDESILSREEQKNKRVSIQEKPMVHRKSRQSHFIKKMGSNSDYDSSFHQPNVKRKSVYTSQMFIERKQNFKPFNIDLNQQGRVILPSKYVAHHFNLEPRGSALYPRIQSEGGNQILRQNFQFDNSGSMVLINQRIIEAYNNVVRQMIKKIKSNFLQGKSLINISLPVTIFKEDSNSQRMLKSWCMAPYFIQEATKIKNKIQRMKFAVAFGISTSVYYFDIQKVFNPILGQTFQAFVAGCPIYAQQISHHPPILAVLLVGRAYKVFASVEAKVQVRANSAAGSNDGIINIVFGDGQKICFTNPRGEVSGLMLGKMSFRFIGTTYYFDIQNRVIAEVVFEDPNGFFSKNKWQKQTQIQGRIMIVTQEFINKFIDSNCTKKPQKKDIQAIVHTISGQWTGDLKFDGYPFYSFAQQKPFEFIEEPTPLNSHANYREDIIYRKMNDLQRSQRQKQWLQQLQRNDRKLRQKKGDNKK